MNTEKIREMNQLTLKPISHFTGEVTVPGSKSLSNRALLLAALCEGPTTITNLLDSDDIRHMLVALEQLGVKTELSADKTSCVVHGCGGRFVEPSEDLFLGNAGTAMRPLAAILAASNISASLTGEPRMYERPIGHLVEALTPTGAQISYQQADGFPPLSIKPFTKNSDSDLLLSIDGSVSSQFLTSVLMAAPLFKSKVIINIIGDLVSKPYIDLTISILKSFGIDVENNNYSTFTVTANQTYTSPNNYMVEGDASSASYFLAAGAISGGPVKVYGVGKHSVQGDIQFARALEDMGAQIDYQDTSIEVRRSGELNAIQQDMNHIPDAAMTLATLALFAKGTTKLSNIYNWRVKETDRLHAMASELKKVGAIVEEGSDFISITPYEINHAVIDTYDDHRIAMCFSLLSFAPCGVTINDPKVTSKTFPDYFERFNKLISN